MTSTNNPQAIREAVKKALMPFLTYQGVAGNVTRSGQSQTDITNAILSAIAPLLAPTPPVSTSAEKCAREIAAKTYVNDRGYLQSDVDENGIAAIISRHFNGQGEDSALLDWLQAQLRNMDSTRGGTWLRIGDKGRLQVHRHTNPHHVTHLIWNDELCVLDSIPDATNDLRSALRSAMSAQTQG